MRLRLEKVDGTLQMNVYNNPSCIIENSFGGCGFSFYRIEKSFDRLVLIPHETKKGFGGHANILCESEKCFDRLDLSFGGIKNICNQTLATFGSDGKYFGGRLNKLVRKKIISR